jgi:hypothetical protein
MRKGVNHQQAIRHFSLEEFAILQPNTSSSSAWQMPEGSAYILRR